MLYYKLHVKHSLQNYSARIYHVRFVCECFLPGIPNTFFLTIYFQKECIRYSYQGDLCLQFYLIILLSFNVFTLIINNYFDNK